ncbi:hypothetical protein FRC09_020998 [Ceratobasidium sp. 395]|nr:hypothetical protein FRC09_020998 [Ceratobasidium sp. 395]
MHIHTEIEALVPQNPLPVAPLIEEHVPHIPILPDAVNMNHKVDDLDFIGPVAPNNGLLLLPQAPAPLSGSLLGLQGLQDAQDI